MPTKPSVEQEWLHWVASCPDPWPALREFARQYHFFSIRQVIAFTGLFRRVSATDREALASLADVLHEELGAGDPAQVHSALFQRFAASVGVDPAELPLDEAAVAPGVRAYVAALHEAFDGPSPAGACAAYVFLESSAVETYGPLLETLRGIGATELTFFERHATVEPDHKAAAEKLAARYREASSDDYEATLRRLGQKWDGFWHSIAEVTRLA